jgi:hypothetical protein
VQHRPSVSANFGLNELPLEEATGVVERHTVEKLSAIDMRGGYFVIDPRLLTGGGMTAYGSTETGATL